jgi:protein-tyrosine phosphatase
VGEGRRQGAVTVEIDPHGARPWFRLTSGGGRALELADRNLHLPSAPNFRDVGGYRTEDGRWVRMGLVFRAEQLNRLSSADLAKVSGLGVRLICDLRTAEERSAAPDPVLPDAELMSADVMQGRSLLTMQDREDIALFGAWLKSRAPTSETYRDFVRAKPALEGYRAIFQRLSRPRPSPTVLHCTAGKDRTGWAAAVLLTALGVPRSTVVDDFLLSNVFRASANQASIAHARSKFSPDIAAIWERAVILRPEYLEAAFDEVNRTFGSFEAYLQRGMGLAPRQVDALRLNYLT